MIICNKIISKYSHLFDKEPFTKREALIWMYTTFNDLGEINCSKRSMAKIWGWNEVRVRRFMSKLASNAIIDVKSDAAGTSIKISNYNDFIVTDKISDASIDVINVAEKEVSNSSIVTTNTKKEFFLEQTYQKSYKEISNSRYVASTDASVSSINATSIDDVIIEYVAPTNAYNYISASIVADKASSAADIVESVAVNDASTSAMNTLLSANIKQASDALKNTQNHIIEELVVTNSNNDAPCDAREIPIYAILATNDNVHTDALDQKLSELEKLIEISKEKKKIPPL